MPKIFKDRVDSNKKFKWYRIHTHYTHEDVRYTISFKVKAPDDESGWLLATKQYNHTFGNEFPEDSKIMEAII